MRGTGLVYDGPDGMGGITPAYAGNSHPQNRCRPPYEDHPRVCGEQFKATLSGSGSLGSPPRMRGTESAAFSVSSIMGITPAYAGNSCANLNTKRTVWDHPRVCGEQKHVWQSISCSPGSPPRMRGTAARQAACIWLCRITPAYAGNSRISFTGDNCGGDHPRVCGEQGSKRARKTPLKGSPPRMRGTGMQTVNQPSLHGITPAYAGNRARKRLGFHSQWDHPRVCGEQHSPMERQKVYMGSPPRMRGTGAPFT